jgi:hypothetical protein
MTKNVFFVFVRKSFLTFQNNINFFINLKKNLLTSTLSHDIIIMFLAEVVELADALDSKSSDGNIVRVRFPPSAP